MAENSYCDQNEDIQEIQQSEENQQQDDNIQQIDQQQLNDNSDLFILPDLPNQPEHTIKDVQNYMNELIYHQNQCEKYENYSLASMLKDKIKEAYYVLHQKHQMNLQNQLDSEQMGVDQAHFAEVEEFKQFWDSKLDQFADESETCRQNLLKRQNQEMQNLIQNLEKQISIYPKGSSEILNYKKIEETLVKQKNYNEAQQVQKERVELEKQEQIIWEKQRNQKIQNQTQSLKTKHNNEFSALNQRILSGVDELQKNRQQEYDRLIQKYVNVKQELRAQHNIELHQFLKKEQQLNNKIEHKIKYQAKMISIKKDF